MRNSRATVANMNENKQPVGEYEKHVEENRGDYRVKKHKITDLAAKIICAVVAIGIWFYVASNDRTIVEKTYRDVQVELRNLDKIEEEYGLSVIGSREFTVDVTVKGSKSDINRLSDGDVTAFVDFKDVTEADETCSLKIQTVLPGGTTLSDMSSDQITVYVDKLTSRSLPIQLDLRYTIEASYELGEPEIRIGGKTVTDVVVTGPAEELEKITKVLATTDLGNITKSLDAKNVLLTLVGNNLTSSLIRLQNSSVDIRVPVYTHKEVPLTVASKYGYYNDKNTEVTIVPASVTLVGDPDVLADLDHIQLLTFDEKKIEGDITQIASISLPAELRDQVEFEGTPVTEASVALKHINTETRDVILDAFSVTNPQGLRYRIVEDSLTVRFRGSKSLLSSITKNNTRVALDLTYVSAEDGSSQKIPVTISLPNALSNGLYELGEYALTVEFLSPEETE